MEHSDISQRFVINHSGIRGQWTLLDNSFQEVLAKHDYPMEIQALLGEMMAAATLLIATLKFEGSMIIQARGEGPVSLATVECTHNHQLRAVARWQGQTQGMNFTELLQKSTLAITITPAKGERYQGVVPLEGANLSECLQLYFQMSEQLKTQIQLFHGNNRCGGLLLQVLPDSTDTQTDPELRANEWERVTALAATLTAEELLNLDCPTLLHRLFHEEEVALFPATQVRFECSCSRDKTADTLVQFGQHELEQLLKERGQVEVTCQYCNALYRFDSVDIAMLFHGQGGGSDSNQSH